MEKRLKRLEIAVVVLSILFVLSIFVSIYAVSQITMLSNKIPSYTEIKNDIKYIKAAYVVSEAKVKEMHVQETVSKAYNYTSEKTGALVDYLKEQREKHYGK